ncbi:MAG: hypothetical protein KGK01_09900 [Bradyrhizobium sp.]|nr:hypothetical protein [Pseudomonadota bacterium]MDE2069144.1 hypothetical protein [Bradyrhizobium sp.]MDE2242730.1 hypothetical protein [Bradyrhizobium sp.]MDE2467658.1 hypothetical protein [Bradyrhizobium sp.]
MHHAASASGLPVPARTVALSPEIPIASWEPTPPVGVDAEVLEWIASQMRGRPRSNRTLMKLVAAVAAVALLQMPKLFDIGT